MNSSDQEFNKELGCVRCGVKDSELMLFKYNLPICYDCRKKFIIWQNGKRLEIFLISLFCAALGVLIFLLYGLLIMDKYLMPGVVDQTYIMVLGWFQIALSIASVLLICIILLFILKRHFGSNLKKYIKFDNGVNIKSETDTKWIPYQDWVRAILHDTDFTEEKLAQFTQNQFRIQESIKASNNKKGNISIAFGISFLVYGIIALLYGAAVSLPLGFPHGTTAFWALHIPSSLPFVIIGIGTLVYGIKKKK